VSSICRVGVIEVRGFCWSRRVRTMTHQPHRTSRTDLVLLEGQGDKMRKSERQLHFPSWETLLDADDTASTLENPLDVWLSRANNINLTEFLRGRQQT